MGSRGDGGRRITIDTIGTGYVIRGVTPRVAGILAALFRLSKPGIVAAVLMAGFTGMVLGERGLPDGKTGFICMASLLLSAAGSAMLNGVLDADIDLRMDRLLKRCAALETAGRKPVMILAVSGIGVALFLALNFLSLQVFLLILAASLSYTLLYTLSLKRLSPWGAVPGGIPGALPVLIGYTSAAHTVRLDGIILFIFMLLWQPPHFWSLALGYRKEYEGAGVPVMPVARGVRFTKLLILVYAAALIPASLSLWLFGYCSIGYGAFALTCGIAFLSACCFSLVDSRRSGIIFCASIIYLLLLFAAIIVDVCFIQGLPS